jgi:hypothetical protein
MPRGPRPASQEPPEARRRPGSPAADQFDGGYAPVIRATDVPARPARPSRPATPAPNPEVFVYREPGTEPDTRAQDAAYWYEVAEERPAPVPEEVRGFFEPLVSSSGPPPEAVPSEQAPSEQAPSEQAPSEQAPSEQAPSEQALSEQAPAGHPEGNAAEPPQARARKLEQLKDLYLTAEAIGEQNVDKHFDQLLAQQRELISEYFRESAGEQPRA